MPECNHDGCTNEATHQGPAGGPAPNPPIVARCDEHAQPGDKKL